MKSNYKFGQKFLWLIFSCALALGLVACQDPDPKKGTTELISPVEGVPNEYLGTWENNEWGHCEYKIEKNKIFDGMSDCIYNVVSTTTPTSTDGYTLILTQCAKGTQYTPKGYYFAVAIKLDTSTNKLSIYCPMDYEERYTSVQELLDNYDDTYECNPTHTTYDPTVCTLYEPSVILTDSSEMYSKLIFKANSVELQMMKASGWDQFDSFTPVRDTAKEKNGVSLYLYGVRSLYSGDLQYLTIKSDGTIYYYLYDEDSEETDGNNDTIAFVLDYGFPTATADELESIIALYASN